MPRHRNRLRSQLDEDEAPRHGTQKLTSGDYFHVAEIHGPNETRGLRPWARDRVLARMR